MSNFCSNTQPVELATMLWQHKLLTRGNSFRRFPAILQDPFSTTSKPKRERQEAKKLYKEEQEDWCLRGGWGGKGADSPLKPWWLYVNLVKSLRKLFLLTPRTWFGRWLYCVRNGLFSIHQGLGVFFCWDSGYKRDRPLPYLVSTLLNL